MPSSMKSTSHGFTLDAPTLMSTCPLPALGVSAVLCVRPCACLRERGWGSGAFSVDGTVCRAIYQHLHCTVCAHLPTPVNTSGRTVPPLHCAMRAPPITYQHLYIRQGGCSRGGRGLSSTNGVAPCGMVALSTTKWCQHGGGLRGVALVYRCGAWPGDHQPGADARERRLATETRFMEGLHQCGNLEATENVCVSGCFGCESRKRA